MMRKISVSDITIKHTDASQDSVLSFRKKLEVAKLLDKLNVSVIETGPICNGKSDVLLLKSISSSVKNAALAVPVDITDIQSVSMTWEAIKTAVHPRLQVSVPVSTVQMEYLCHKKPAAILQTISEFVAACSALCADVEFVAGDFNRSEPEFLRQAIDAAVNAGATLVTLYDISGDFLPDEFYKSVKDIHEVLPENVKLGVWCSNELFMADSCAVSSVRAGADEIKTMPFDNYTASLKRFVRILSAREESCKAGCDVNVTELQRIINQMKRLCETKKQDPFAAIEGLKMSQDDIRLTIHDDQEAVMSAVHKLGYDLSEDDAEKVFATFVRLASKNEIIEAKELDAIVASIAFQVPPTYKLESYVINSGNIISATCHLRLRKDDAILETVCVGDGPVDAAFQAIETVVDRQYELDDFQIQSVTEGREALGEAVVRLRYEGKVYSGRGISTDIVGSSISAYLNAVNKIAYEEDEA